jgi:hypothetical protein
LAGYFVITAFRDKIADFVDSIPPFRGRYQRYKDDFIDAYRKSIIQAPSLKLWAEHVVKSVKEIFGVEQAAALAPRDADIRANLELARQQTRDRVNQVLAPEPARTPGNQTVAHQQPRGPVNSPIAGPLGALADVSSRWLTVDELALLALGAWLALGFLVFAYRGLQAERRPAVVRAAVAVAFAIVLATSGMLASRMATPRLAAPATIRGQPPAGTAGQQAATPSGVSNPSQG